MYEKNPIAAYTVNIMKTPCIRNWAVDFAIALVLAGLGLFLLPLFAACFAAIVHSLTLAYLLPHAIIGGLLGSAAGSLIRRKNLLVAGLPAVLLSGFYLLYLSIGRQRYHWGQSRLDFVIVASWLVLLTAALFSAALALKVRARVKGVNP